MSGETFNPEIELAPEEGVPDWAERFGRAAPLTLEIGTGNGVFMACEAAARPGVNFIGIERAGEFHEKCRKRMIRENLRNVRTIRIDVNELFDAHIAPGSLDEVICICSDPWPKRKHRHRRVFRPAFIDRLEGMIRAGGRLRYKTDVGWYFNLTIAEFRRRPQWEIERAGPEEEGSVVTNFEGRARRAGDPIWGFEARLITPRPVTPDNGKAGAE